MPSQRPFFLSSFIAAFRQQGPSIPSSAPQPNKHTGAGAAGSSQATASSSTSNGAAAASASSASRSISTSAVATAAASHHNHNHHHQHTHHPSPQTPPHSAGIPIQNPGSHQCSSRRRGSDSSSEGFRDVLGADKWYIGGRTAGGEEKFFKLGVVRRVRSNDGLSLDRLSL